MNRNVLVFKHREADVTTVDHCPVKRNTIIKMSSGSLHLKQHSFLAKHTHTHTHTHTHIHTHSDRKTSLVPITKQKTLSFVFHLHSSQ